MKRLLQPFGFKESAYERPNQKWLCGRTHEGSPCVIGPGSRGECRATFECNPRKKGDRWLCTRPVYAGGSCQSGPLPDGTCCRPIPKCTPIRSLRSKRNLTVWITLGFTLGFGMLLLTLKSGREFASPGAVIAAHSSLATDCLKCHQSSAVSSLDWRDNPHGDEDELTSSQKCMECHDLGGNALNPHSLNSEALAAITQRIASPDNKPGRPLSLGLAAVFGKRDGSQAGDLTCADCHKEHLGKDHDLTHISNVQCQSCHAVQFASFSNGHPDFEYRPSRSAVIKFDHHKHLNDYFLQEKHQGNARTCVECHELDDSGSLMSSRSFESMCATCHLDSIHRNPAVTFFNLPLADVELFADAGVSIGGWPEETFDDGIEPSPFMQLLLSAEAEASSALQFMSENEIGLDSFDPEETEELEAATTVVWAVKELLLELATAGPQAIVDRLTTVLDEEVPLVDVQDLVRQMPVATAQAAIDAWLPNLAEEVPQWNENQSLEAEDSNVDSPGESWNPDDDSERLREVELAGGWYRSDFDFTINYRVAGHADPFLSSWLELSLRSSDEAEAGPERSIFQTLSHRDTGPGNCMKCHTTSQATHSHIAWSPAQAQVRSPQFTPFRHEPHFDLLSNNDCTTCHEINQDQRPERGFAGDADETPPDVTSLIHSRIKPIHRSNCASCHTEEAAGDSCLLCHNYHVGEIPRP